MVTSWLESANTARDLHLQREAARSRSRLKRAETSRVERRDDGVVSHPVPKLNRIPRQVGEQLPRARRAAKP
jgi:hypothetical protein